MSDAPARRVSDLKRFKKPTVEIVAAQKSGMNKRIHNVTETRDWAKIILAAGTAIAAILTAASGVTNLVL